MPDLVIKEVETFGSGKQDSFNFADHEGTLFEWNNKVDALEGEGLVKEDIILYPSITAEFLGVALTPHLTPIKEEFEPHGCVEDAATCNANFGPVAIAEVDARVIHANPDKNNDICDDNDNDLMHVRNIHPNQHTAQNLIVMLDWSDDDHNNNKNVKLDNDNSSNNDDNNDDEGNNDKDNKAN
jgi:hypothetical protein